MYQVPQISHNILPEPPISFGFQYIFSTAMSTSELTTEIHRAIGELNKEKLVELLNGDTEPADLSKVRYIEQ